jgi:hypothetical protein
VAENLKVPKDVARGFHINQMYSYTMTPGELVQLYLAGFGDEVAACEFHNSSLGRPFVGDGARVDDVMLDGCIGNHSKNDLRPRDGTRWITMGIDRGKWCHYVICEWFFTSWGLDVNVSATCKVLYEGKFLEEHFEKRADELMHEWQVHACVVDADPGPNDFRRFARRFPGHVWGCRYRDGKVNKEISVDAATAETEAPIATVDRTNWLSASLGRFKTKPSRIVLPHDISEEFRGHVKALVSTYVRDKYNNPVLDYVTIGGQDHFAHALNYAEIALPLCGSTQVNLDLRNLM